MDQQQSLAAQTLEADNAQVVAHVMGRNVTRGELSAAFSKVQNPVHWKLPVEAQVRIRFDFDTDYQIALIREAVVFYTGSRATFTTLSSDYCSALYLVEAPGYYKAIGA